MVRRLPGLILRRSQKKRVAKGKPRIGAVPSPLFFALEKRRVEGIQAGEDAAVKIGSTIHSLHERVYSLQTLNHTELRRLGESMSGRSLGLKV